MISKTAIVKYWEIIADNLSKAGWSWGCASAIDSNGRTIWIADAYRDNGKRLVVRSEEKLTAFVKLESAILQLRKRQSRLREHFSCLPIFTFRRLRRAS